MDFALRFTKSLNSLKNCFLFIMIKVYHIKLLGYDGIGIDNYSYSFTLVGWGEFSLIIRDVLDSQNMLPLCLFLVVFFCGVATT